MKLAIRQPDLASDTWALIPQDHRAEIRAMLKAFEQAPDKGITKWLEDTADQLGTTYGTLRNKFYAVKATGGWEVLVDKKRADIAPPSAATTREPRFVTYLLQLADGYQRKSAPAIKELKRRWRVKDPIPGYEGWPGWPALPEGWSARNLHDVIAEAITKEEQRALRVGTSSKTNGFLPHIITTRKGLWCGAIIQLDDVWHDNYVTVGRKREICRVLELGALDVFSGHRFHWGAKPRRKRENGTWETIAAKDMRLYLAGLLHRFGSCPQGMQFMSEHQTAKVDEDIARLLYDASGGMIRVEYQPIETLPALTGYWPGSEGGNFHAKACLESTHNLIHNDLSALALQTGSPSSGLKGPVTTDRIIAYIARMLKKVQDKVPHRLDLLRLPALDFHTQFIPFITDYYHYGLAMRDDHELEAWEALGHIVTEYTLLPGSDQWLTEFDFLRLPAPSQAALSAAVRDNPKQWSQRRKLRPLEVWDRRPQWSPVAPTLLCDIVGKDLAREVTCRNGMLEFRDQEISPDPLVFSSTYTSGPKRGERIHHDEKVNLVVFPFDDSLPAFALDAKGRVLGGLPLKKRILPIDVNAFGSSAPYDMRPTMRSQDLTQAAGEKRQETAAILAPARMRNAEKVAEARELQDHNKRLLDPSIPATAEEIETRDTNVSAARFGRHLNRAAAAAATQAQGQGTAADPDAEDWTDTPAESFPTINTTIEETW